MKPKILLIGGGGHCKSVIDVIEKEGRFEIAGIIEKYEGESQTVVNANASIGENCIINSKALIEHDAMIEDNVHISTGAIINGTTTVKENSFVGSGSITKEGICVSGFVKAGSVAK